MGVTQRNNRSTTLLFVILLIPFLSISGIRNHMPTSVYQIWQSAAMLVMVLLFITVISKLSMNWAVITFGMYQAVIFISTFIHHGFSSGILVVMVAAFLIFALLQSDYYNEILLALVVIVVVSAIINLPVLISKINEENAEFFIGGKNVLSMFLIPGTFLLIIRSLELNGEITRRTKWIVSLCTISVFLGSSGTGIIVAVVAGVLVFLTRKYQPNKEIYILVLLICYVLLIIFPDKLFETEAWVKFADLLGKDATLTSRTGIWKTAKDIIQENWFLGTGRGTRIVSADRWGRYEVYTEAHNFILEILMEGGVVALALYSFLVSKVVKHLDMTDYKNRIVLVALCIILINGLTESTLNNFFVTIVLAVACRNAEENRVRRKLNEQQI